MNTDHIEDMRGMVYAFRRKGQDAFCTCDEYRYNELSDKPHLFETTVFYTHQTDCPRCAVHEKNIVEIIRDYDTKLDALEAENKSLKELFTVDKDGATMADRYLDLKAELKEVSESLSWRNQELNEKDSTIAALEAELIKQRDAAEEYGTRLANAISEFFRVDVGEYSSANDPRDVALDILDGVFVTDSDTDRKLATLEAENARLIQQVNAFYLSNPQGGIVTRLQATIAQQAERIKELEAETRGVCNLSEDLYLKAIGLNYQLAAAELDAERYRWLRDATGETPIRPAAFNSEIMPDIRLKFDFPTLVSYNCIGVQYTLDEAIDAAIAASREGKS